MPLSKRPVDGPRKVFKFTYEELVNYTDNFSESNYIGRFQYGKLYRGKVNCPRHIEYIVVKIWEVPEVYSYEPGDNACRLMDEIILLRHELVINHPGMVRLYGYYSKEGFFSAVYEFKPFDSVFNLIPKDGYTWLQRIKTAFGLASLLKFLHSGKVSFDKPFIVRNLDAAHILLDEDYNPKLCDFGAITGGIFPDRTIYGGRHEIGCHGYKDVSASGLLYSHHQCAHIMLDEEYNPKLCDFGAITGGNLPDRTIYGGHHDMGCRGCMDVSASGNWSDKQDVFAFGVILVSLISKEVYDRESNVPFVYERAWREYEAYESNLDMNKPEFSLVHKSLTEEPDFCTADGYKISALALKCVNRDESQRPNMKQVSRSLNKLEVVKQNSRFLGLNKNTWIVRRGPNGTYE